MNSFLKPQEAVAVHLVTILYRSEDALPAFLDSLQAQDLVNWRLHIIDNASPDGSHELVTQRADCRFEVIRNLANLGFAKAANQGLRAAIAAGGEFVILINNDTVLARDFLRRFVAARINLQADVIVPRIQRLEDPDRSWYAGAHFEDDWVFKNVHDDDDATQTEPRAVECATGCCLGLSRAVLERVGLLDERFFVYWEDTDFCMRLRQNDVPIIYVREPALLHAAGSSSGGEFSASYCRLFYRSYIQFLRKHFGFAYAIRTMGRILAKEIGRKPLKGRLVSTMARAMLRGLATPSVAQSYLLPTRLATASIAVAGTEGRPLDVQCHAS